MTSIIPQIRRANPAPVMSTPTGLPSASSIDLQIDALVFHGFSRAESRRASTAFQQELARLLTTADLGKFETQSPEGEASRHQRAGSFDPSNSHVEGRSAPAEPRDVDVGNIRVSRGHPESTGRQAAQALLGGLRP